MNGFLDELGQAFDEATARDHNRREHRGRQLRRAALVAVPALLVVGTLAAWSTLVDGPTQVTTGPASEWSESDETGAADPDQSEPAPSDRSGNGASSLPSVPITPSTDPAPETVPPSGSPATTEGATPSTTQLATEPTTQSTTDSAPETAPCGDPIEAMVTEATTDGAGPMIWVPGLTVTARSADGQGAELEVRDGMTLGVAGGRYRFQIDYMPELEASEQLILNFEAPICWLQLTVANLARNEHEGLDETLSWVARDDTGLILATGLEGPTSGRGTPPGLIQASTIAIDIPPGTTMVELGAAPYGDGAEAGTDSNSSDWALAGVSTSPVD